MHNALHVGLLDAPDDEQFVLNTWQLINLH